MNMKKLNNLSTYSGIYYFYCNDELLYIGKAKNLKKRIDNHNYQYQEFEIIAKKNKEITDNDSIDTDLLNYNIISMLNFQRIDMIFNQIDKITVKKVSEIDLTMFEKSEIMKYRPPFNYQTARYDQLIDDLINDMRKLQRKMVRSFFDEVSKPKSLN